MEIQLQELLDTIKREGVETARTEAEAVIADANARKKAILDEAEREAQAVVAKARAEAARAEESGRAALAHASRDLLLSFRDQLQALLDTVIRADTLKACTPEVLAEAIPAVLKGLAAAGVEDPVVLLPPALLKKLDAHFLSRLTAELKKGVELKPSADLDAGFRVSEKAGAAYYDFSAEAVAALLSQHLNAKLAQIVKNAAQGT
jgi:V/A-type H+/Na+-transporting ATPase subunit E